MGIGRQLLMGLLLTAGLSMPLAGHAVLITSAGTDIAFDFSADPSAPFDRYGVLFEADSAPVQASAPVVIELFDDGSTLAESLTVSTDFSGQVVNGFNLGPGLLADSVGFYRLRTVDPVDSLHLDHVIVRAFINSPFTVAVQRVDLNAASLPEPGTLSILGCVLLGLVLTRRRTA